MASNNPIKAALKRAAMRAMRPGLSGVNEQLARINQTLGSIGEDLASLGQFDADQRKYDSELAYWRWLIKEGGAERDFGAPFEQVFARWTRDRVIKLGHVLGLPAIGSAGDIDDWAKNQAVVEIGAGPYPLIASVRHGWRWAAAVDPVARGYCEGGLLPEAARRLVYIASKGETVPLPCASADLVVIENCLDHVRAPDKVVAEIFRLLRPGGHVWIFVDLSNHVDEMHPHGMNEDKVRQLLAAPGLTMQSEEVTSHKAHPQAYGGYFGLWSKPSRAAYPIQE